MTAEGQKAKLIITIGEAINSCDDGQLIRAMERLLPLLRAADRSRVPLTPTAVIEKWRTDGPLIHESTGIAMLDELTGGGPVYGSRWYLVGAPDAGKTAFLMQVADTYLKRGIAVGLLGVDEEPDDLMMRLAQRRGFTREQCEERKPETLKDIGVAVDELPLRFYDALWTIEAAADDLAQFAEKRGLRAMLGIDSIQTVTSEREDPARSVREAVTARAWAVRHAAQRHRMIVMATSEMNRAAYRSVEAVETSNDVASAKESGAIEFSARVMLSLRNASGECDLMEVRLAKNKHGPRNERFHLRLDRDHQMLHEAVAPERVDPETAKAERERRRTEGRAAVLAVALVDRPGMTSREVRAVMKAHLGACSVANSDAAKAALGAAVVRREGRKGAQLHYLDGRHVSDSILALLEPEQRVQVGNARPCSD